MDKHSAHYANMGIPVFISLILLIFISSSLSYAGKDPMEDIYRGIKIITVPPASYESFDVDIMDGDTALSRLKQAIDLIYEKSPANAQAIDAVKERGDISLNYNPNYPHRKHDISSLNLAVFLPFYFDHPTDGKKLPVPIVISRHGIKWPLPQLAAIIIHELAGHGAQYLNGMMDRVRSRELECHAWLLEELAYQDFGLDKYDEKMIRFRQQLGGVGGYDGICSDFLRHIRKTSPEKMALYEQLNPNVPALLEMLDQYIAHMDSSGEAKKALQARAEYIESELVRIEKFETPENQFSTGLYLLFGAGLKQDPTKGAMFIRKAAERNLIKAQFLLVSLYEYGKGVNQDKALAYFWLCVAEGQADSASREIITNREAGFIKILSQKQRNEIALKARNWKPEN